MLKENYRGFTITLSDEDREKCKKSWQAKHWKCIVYNKADRKQMGFDVFGGLSVKMTPIQALYLYLSDACDYMNMNLEDLIDEFGMEYKEAKEVYNLLSKAYYKCRKFIGTDDDIIDILDELRPKFG